MKKIIEERQFLLFIFILLICEKKNAVNKSYLFYLPKNIFYFWKFWEINLPQLLEYKEKSQINPISKLILLKSIMIKFSLIEKGIYKSFVFKLNLASNNKTNYKIIN